ncbi:unnamed protein product, partial [Prorocentrum cordatum]
AAAFLRTRRRTPLTACAGGAHAQCNARQEESLSPQRRPDAISAQIQAFPRERICSGGGGDGGKGSRTREQREGERGEEGDSTGAQRSTIDGASSQQETSTVCNRYPPRARKTTRPTTLGRR